MGQTSPARSPQGLHRISKGKTTMPAKKKISFEQKLVNLEEIVQQVEDADTPLEKSIALYKDGIALAKDCNETLRTYEEEIHILQKTADEFTLEPFSAVR